MKYLIVKTSSIGDIVQTFPVVQYLKTKDLHCEIDWVVEEEYAELVKAHPDVQNVLTIATRKWSFRQILRSISRLRKTPYDVVFDLQGNSKSACVTACVRAQKKVGFAFSSLPEWPNYFVTNQKFGVQERIPIQRRYLSIVQQFFKDPIEFEPKGVELILDSEETLRSLVGEGKPRIMVAFSSRWENKTLSFPMWLDILKGVGGPFYFVTGGGKEKSLGEALSSHFPGSIVLENLPFALWQRVMGKMALVVAVDSAALALCGTTSTPSMSFFGPTKASVYKPLGDSHRHFQGSCPYGVSFASRCPKLRTCPTGACLKGISSIDLLRN